MRPSDVRLTVQRATVQVHTSRGTRTAFYIGTGEFITAAHVVEGETQVRLASPLVDVSATVVGLDFASDVAVLAANVKLEALAWGDSREIVLGNKLGVMGYQLGFSGPASYTSGAVSRKFAADGVSYIQTDAAINPGNSGGPVFNDCGRVVWIVVSGPKRASEGIDWAVAEETATVVVRRARANPPTTTCSVQTVTVPNLGSATVPLGDFAWEQLLTVSYAVAQGSSGTLDIAFALADVNGQIVSGPVRQPAGKIDEHVPSPGKYFARLDNSYSIFTQKTVSLTWCTYRR
ncbi:MAG: hypothetical protein EXR65_03395 [Dehalococcoidia bacterium]|nr:hypothetical protein [Dehalococcoidia bacterium]